MQINKPKIMGIINLTQDSFYPPSRHNLAGLENQLTNMIDYADIIDLGAESTRPGASEVSAEQQIVQLIPAIKMAKQVFDGIISIDTSNPKVMQACLQAGADMINDVRSLAMSGAFEVIADSNAQICLTHMLGSPKTMQIKPEYPEGVINTIMLWFENILTICEQYRIEKQRIFLDPGFGFGKTISDNWQILNQLEIFTERFNITVGVSNKSMFKEIYKCEDVTQRSIPTAIAEAIATIKKVAIIRSHDVHNTKQAIETGTLLGLQHVWH